MTLISIALGLFWMAFLAATVLPFSSEAALSAALLTELPPAWCLIVATGGNSLGSITTFLLGRMGKIEWLKKYCKIDQEGIANVQRKIGKFGSLAAFGCFIPLIGDGFAIALGFMRYSVWKFVFFMTLGKLLRYAIWVVIHICVTAAVV